VSKTTIDIGLGEII